MKVSYRTDGEIESVEHKVCENGLYVRICTKSKYAEHTFGSSYLDGYFFYSIWTGDIDGRDKNCVFIEPENKEEEDMLSIYMSSVAKHEVYAHFTSEKTFDKGTIFCERAN